MLLLQLLKFNINTFSTAAEAPLQSVSCGAGF